MIAFFAAAAESGILMQAHEALCVELLFRSFVKTPSFFRYEIQSPSDWIYINKNHETVFLFNACKPGLSKYAWRRDLGFGEFSTLNNDGQLSPAVLSSTYSIIVNSPLTPFSVNANQEFIYRPKERLNEQLNLEPAASGKTFIEWGQTAEIGWAVTAVSRNIPFAPPRRLIKIFSATDGTLLAKTQIAQEAPVKGLAVAFKMKADAPDGLVVITGAGLSWWAPKAEHIDDWGEITLDLAVAKSAE